MKRFLTIFITLFTLYNISGANIQAQSQCKDLDVVIFGDSMTWIGGEDSSQPTGWTYHFNKRIHPNSITTYARSGATITNTSVTRVNPDKYSEILDNDNVIYNQVSRYIIDFENNKISAPSLFIIYAGGNDAWFENKRPGSFEISLNEIQEVNYSDLPQNRTTLGESLALAVKNLKRTSPYAKILLITPIEMSKVPAEKIHSLSDKIQIVGEALDCDVLRADQKVEIRHDEELKKPRFTKDGVHTNPTGATLLSDVISEYVIENYCKNK